MDHPAAKQELNNRRGNRYVFFRYSGFDTTQQVAPRSGEEGVKKMTRRFVTVVLTALLSLSAIAVAQAQREMTMVEYEVRLRACQIRQRVADSTRTAIERQIAQKRAEIGTLEQQIVALARQTLDAVGAADSAAVRTYLGQLDAIIQQLQAMRQLSADQIVTARERGDLDRIDAQLTQLKTNRISALPEAKAKIRTADQMITELRAVQRPVPEVRRDQYTVVRGDYLWKIAKKPEIYGDPYTWVRLYSANKDRIRNPDLIYPNWVLGVPRNQAPGTYWVKRGDRMRTIAQEVYGDPTQWMKIYRANKDMIRAVSGGRRVIYPNMILDIPQN
jgi:nucleoid-associated protein YgaU